jgi:hypothetical protein
MDDAELQAVASFLAECQEALYEWDGTELQPLSRGLENTCVTVLGDDGDRQTTTGQIAVAPE